MSKEFYFVPATLNEIYQLPFISSLSVNNYFKHILKTERPTHTEPLIVFERDASYPGEIFAIVYDENSVVIHYLYLSSESVLMPYLKKYYKPLVREIGAIPSFEKFKRENSNIKTVFKGKTQMPLFFDGTSIKSVGGEHAILSSSSSKTKVADPLTSMLVMIFLSLFLLLVLKKNKKTMVVVEDPSFGQVLLGFIDKIKDPVKKEKFVSFLEEMRTTYKRKTLQTTLQRHLQHADVQQSILAFINDNLKDQKVVNYLNRFLSSIKNPNLRNNMEKILTETAGMALPYQQEKKKQQPVRRQQQQQGFNTHKLYQFIKQNRQEIVSPQGAVSPVFIERLRDFLEQQHAEDPSLVVRMISRKAVQLMYKNKGMSHREITDRLLHMMTEQPFIRALETGKQTVSFVIDRLSLKSKQTERLKSVLQQQQQQQKQQKKQQKKVPEWAELVRRTAKPSQSQLGVAVVDANIQNILHGSKRFREIANTLCTLIKVRQIKRVLIVDAPNVLFTSPLTYRERQKFSRDVAFLDVIQDVVGYDPHMLFVIVSQMNRTEWKDNDQVFFGRIGDDNMNAFIVRVGCFDGSNNTDCSRSINTNNHNECDDFVRLDLMARTIDMLQKEQGPIPEFIQITQDAGRNWEIIKPEIRNHIKNDARHAARIRNAVIENK